MALMRIRAIAANTFREAVRDKILYSLLFFALVMIGSSVLVAELTIGEFLKIVKDVGLGSISIFGVLIAVFVGIQLVNREIDRKTVYTVLSKPVHRWEFIVGKFLGLGSTLFIELAVMTLGLLVLIAVVGSQFAPELAGAVALIYLELLFLTAFAILFSTFSTPTLSALFTLSVYVIGHMSNDIYRFGQKAEAEWIQVVSKIVYYVLPNLEYFNIKNQVVHNVALFPGQIGFAVAYGLIYMSIVLFAAVVIFERRDFK